MSTEWMDVPLASADRLFISDTYLDFIIPTANSMLKRGKEKLNRFYMRLSELE